MSQSGSQKAWNAANVGKAGAGLSQGQSLAGTAGTIQGSLLPQFQKMAQGQLLPGQALSAVGGVGAEAGAARDAMTRRLASTGNTAGYGAALDKLSRGQQAESGTQLANLQTGNIKEGLSGMSNLYGVDTSTMAKLMQPDKPDFSPSPWANFGRNLLGTALTGKGPQNWSG